MSTLIDIFTSLKSDQHIKHEKQACAAPTMPRKMHQHSSSFDFYSKSESPGSFKNNSIVSNGSLTSENTSDFKQNHSSNKSPIGIRFLIFSEDSKGRRTNVFDSEGFQHKPRSSMNVTMPTQSSSTSHSVNITNSAHKIHSKISTGSNTSLNKKKAVKNEMLMRMVFGGGPMVVSNRTAIKVHSLK